MAAAVRARGAGDAGPGDTGVARLVWVRAGHERTDGHAGAGATATTGGRSRGAGDATSTAAAGADPGRVPADAGPGGDDSAAATAAAADARRAGAAGRAWPSRLGARTSGNTRARAQAGRPGPAGCTGRYD